MFRKSSPGLTSTLVALLVPISLSPISFAQDESSPLDEIVIIANRIPVPARQLGTSVSIIDEQAIREHGNFSLSEILRQSPAIGVTSNGGIGTVSSLRIRGEEGFRTLTLFDGLRLSDPSSPQVATPLEHILSSGIGRVEILRGPQGLGYGADAGGIISISSKPTEAGISASIDGQAGSRDTDQLSARFAVANELLDFSLIASDYQSDGYNVRASDSIIGDKDGYENTSYHTRLGFNATEKLRLELVHRNVEGETQYDGCFAATIVYDCLAIYELQASRFALNYESEMFNHSLAYSNTRTDRDDLALGSSAFTSDGEISRLEYVGSATQLPGFDLVFGIDLEKEETATLERRNKGYYLEYLSGFSDSFFFTAGLRQDDNDDFGQHSSYRLTSAYLIELAAGELKFKASYGSGFRAPSLFEIDYNAGPFAFAPATAVMLQEESSRGLEYGVEYVVGQRWQLEMVVFDQEVEDAIIFDLSGFSGYLQDRGTSTSEGVELSGEIALTERLRLLANYTYNETERPNGLQRLRRPEQLANLGFNYRSHSQKLTVNAFYRTSRDSVDELFGAPVELDDFDVLDLTASYRISENFEIYGRIENALDERYQEILDFISPDRASYVGLRLNF